MCVGFEYRGHPPATEPFTAASQQPDTSGELAEPLWAHCVCVQPRSRAKLLLGPSPAARRSSNPRRAKNDLPTCWPSPGRRRARVSSDGCRSPRSPPRASRRLSAYGLRGALRPSLIDFTRNFPLPRSFRLRFATFRCTCITAVLTRKAK